MLITELKPAGQCSTANIFLLRHYIDYKLQDIIPMLSEGSQRQQLKYHVQSQPQHFFTVLEKSFEMGNSTMRYTQSYGE